MFCKHTWQGLTETVTESKFESSVRASPKHTTEIKLPHQLCCAERKHIQTFSCAKCGAFKRFVETI